MNPSQWDAQYNGGPSQSPSPYNPSDGDGDGVGTRSCLAFRLPTTKKKEAKGKRGNSNYNDKGSQQSSQQSATSSDMRGLLDNGPSYGWESFHGNSNESDAFASPPAAIQANGRQQQISGAVWDASKTPSSWDAGTTATAASSVSPNRSRSANRGTGASKGTASTAGTASASMNSLLTPPPPSDRSQQRRLQYENESRGQQQHPQQQQRRPEQGLAASEMEPAGRRGQEAAYLPAPVNPGTSAAIHSAANAMAGRSATITSPPSIQTQTQMPTQSVFPGISNLLTPPTPTDRSERRRLQYEQEKRRAADPIGGEGVGVGGGGGGGSYNNGNYNFESSEIEPVGRRGQNAPLPPQAQQSQSQSQSQQSQSQSMSPNLGGLLTPPQPSDRREQRRQRYENEQQQQQQGQNQHPQYPPQSATTNSMPVVRLAQPFLPNSRPSSGMTSSQYARTATAASTAASPPKPPGVMSRMESADTSSSSNSDDDILNMRHDLMDDGEEDEDDEHDDDNDNYENDQNSSDLIQFSPISGQAVRIPAIDQLSPIPGRGQGQGQRSALQASVSPQSRSRAPPASARMESSDSTVSDEDMQYMRPDLQPSFTPTTELSMQTATTAAPLRTPQRQQQAYQNQQYQQHEQPQQPQQQPQRRQEQQSGLAAISPVAAAAAAAAAAAPKSRLRGDELDDRAREIETASVDTLNAKAMEHVQAEDFDVALQLFARVLAIHQKRDGQLHPTVASSYHNLGTVHAKRAALTTEDSVQQQHCRAQALECFQAAARVARDSLGHNHPNVAVSLVRIGFLLLQSRQYQNAIITFKEALRIRLAHYGAQHGLVANLYNNLGVCHMHLGQFGEGSEFLDSGLDIQRHIANETQWLKKNDRWINLLELADTLFNIGGLCLEWIRRQGPDARRAVDAENAFAEAFEVRKFV
jgi:tetratricopeptide (TPR) repeat protein